MNGACVCNEGYSGDCCEYAENTNKRQSPHRNMHNCISLQLFLKEYLKG